MSGAQTFWVWGLNSKPHLMQIRRPGVSEMICLVPHFGHSTGVWAGAISMLCCSLTLSIAFA
jgi:hypothetical protein